MSWPSTQLGSVCTFENGDRGKNYPGKSTLVETGIPFVNAGNLTDGTISDNEISFISPEHYRRISNGKFKKGDFLFCLRGSLGKYAYVEREIEGAIASSLIIVRPDIARLDPRFLYVFFGSDLCSEQIDRFKNGAAQPNLSAASLKQFSIPLPSLEEQKRLAEILDQAAEIFRLRQQVLHNLNGLGQALFHEMFGDPLKDHSTDPRWICETLDTSIHYIDYRGKTPPKAETGIRLITAKNVKNGYLNSEPKEFIEEEAFESWMTRGFPQNGDVLFTTEAPLGNVAILDVTEKLAVGQRILTMRPDKKRMTSEYLAYYLRSPQFIRKMNENSSGSTVRGIKSKLLKKIKICYPALDLQLKFSAALDSLNQAKNNAETACIEAGTLFASLQHRAFRGEL